MSHSMTISGKQNSAPLPQHGQQPQVTNQTLYCPTNAQKL